MIALFQAIVAADHFVDGVEAQAGHNFPQVLCDEAHEVDNVFRFAFEAFAQFSSCVQTPYGQVLRWQTRSIWQPMARSGAVPKPKTSAPKRAAMATSRPVSSLPSTSRVTRSRRRLRSSVCWTSDRPISQAGRHGAGWYAAKRRSRVIAADDDVVGFCFDDTGCNRADAGAGRQFDADRSLAVGVLEVEDKFGQVFDGVDIVMRRR